MNRATARLLTLSLPLAACLATAAYRPAQGTRPLQATRGSAPGARGPRAQAPATRPADELDGEEYAVISAVINGWEKERGGGEEEDKADRRAGEKRRKERVLIIRDETEPWRGFQNDAQAFASELKDSSKELLAETVEDYLAKNGAPHALAARFDTRARYRLVASREVEDIFREKGPAGWEDFYKKFPDSGGFVTFSRVGFNRDRTQALVYQSHSCGGLCGGGACLLFVKRGGGWVERGSVGGVWAS